MNQGPSSNDAPTLPPEHLSHADNIGSCRLIRKLGEGGMGEVWLAEQQHPVRRKVALKLIKLGMDTREVVARFAAEQQALALMDHPSIARIFDAGATPQGRSYFVMEFVPGVPLTEYSDTARLTIRERLGLFLQVCAAVQHAHHKTIIHRDLKPSNVLVSDTERGPAPKVIDFGIAKAMVTPLVDQTMVTQAGGALGTPEYMSPEQLTPGAVDIDTRADIYALGVMLYELLAGAHPIDTRSSTTLEEMRERIRTQNPLRPSTRVARLGADAQSVADSRRTDIAGLARALRDDLDWIVLKALEKDRNRRYGSPMELAGDLERHLAKQPVLARPPSTRYRVGRFVARHRFGVAVSCAAAVVVVGFALAMAILASRLARERDRATQEAASKDRIATFLQDLFNSPNPEQARGRQITAREVLERGVQRIQEMSSEQNALKADLLSTMGNSFSALGDYGEAERMLREAIAVAETSGRDRGRPFEIAIALGRVLERQGRYKESADLLEPMLVRAQATLGLRDESTLEIMDKLALAYLRQHRLTDAARLAEQTVASMAAVLGEDNETTLRAQTTLAMVYEAQGRIADSIRIDEAALRTRRRSIGSDHPNTLRSMNNLASGYAANGRLAEARALVSEAITTGQRVWGPTHPSLGTFVHSLGEIELAAARYAAANDAFNQALAIYERQASHQFLPQLLYGLAQVNARLGNKDAAFEYLGRSIQAGFTPQPAAVDDPHLAPLKADPRFKKWESARR